MGFVWTPTRKRKLFELHHKGHSSSEIAASLGTSKWSILRALPRYAGELNKARRRLYPLHLQEYKKARRGFTVPPGMEDEYINHLKAGKTIAEAREVMGLE